MRFSTGLVALSALLLSGCGDSFQFSAGRSAAQVPSDEFFEERGEQDDRPEVSAPPEQGEGEGGGEVGVEESPT